MEVKREKSTLDEFCLKMKSLVEQQEDHLVRAVTRRGESIICIQPLNSLKWILCSGLISMKVSVPSICKSLEMLPVSI